MTLGLVLMMWLAFTDDTYSCTPQVPMFQHELLNAAS